MRNLYVFLLIAICTGTMMCAQVKIGDNPQNIDPSSVLELESTDKVLVITRVTTAQMNAIIPSQGALCFNTDLQSVHYYNGTQWVNIGGGSGTGGPLTADAIVNTQPTIVITPTATGDNLEVAPNSIRSEQIVDGGVNGVDIQDGSIGPGKLQDFSITQEKLSENSVGAFALDNDSFGVSAFNNDAGYITAADINLVSGDVGNVLENRTDGVFYNDQPLITAINQNTDAIALDDDQSAANEIQNLQLLGNELTISGSNTVTLPSATGEIDDNELITDAVLNGTDLVITEAGTDFTVPLGSLSGGGTADGSETKIDAGTNITIMGDGTIATPYVINAAGGGVGGSDNIDFFVATDSLRITDGAGTLSLALSELGGSGTNQNASQVPFAPYLTINSTDTQAALEELKDEVDILSVSGGDLNSLVEVTTDSLIVQDPGGRLGVLLSDLPSNGSNNSLVEVTTDSLVVEDAGGRLGVLLSELPSNGSNNSLVEVTTDSLVVEDAGGRLGVLLSELPSNGSNNSLVEVTTDSLVVEDAGGRLGILLSELPSNGGNNSLVEVTTDSLVVEDAGGRLGILLSDLPTSNNSLVEVTTDSLIVEDAGGRLGFLRDSLLPKGTAKSIFFAGADGLPRQFFNPNNNEPSFYWDYEGRTAAGQSYGTLAVGLDGGVISNDVKVHIAEQLTAGAALSYALMLQNRANGEGRGVGMVFSVDDFSTTYGKGALVFERDSTFARGDIHFLQNNDETIVNPSWGDKAFTITREKNIGLYGGIDIGGVGTGFGTNNQVLASGGPGMPVKWVNGSTIPEGTAGAIFFSDGAGGLLDKPTELFWDNTNDRLGIGVNNPDTALEVMGEVKSTSFASAQGTATEPAYSFHTGGDTNTGMYRPNADEIGFSVGGFEALKIDEPTLGNTNVIVNQSLELDGMLLDKDGDAGTAGQVLSSVGGPANPQTDWVDSNGPVQKDKVLAGSGIGNGTYNVPVTGQSTADYIINLSVEATVTGDPIIIQIIGQSNTSFTVQISEWDDIAKTYVGTDANWHYTIYNP